MEDAENKRFIYEFGEFVLDPQEKTLFVEGKPVHLPAKEFETLLLLVENSGRALSKQEIISVVWQNAFVEEGNLAQKISHLRKFFNPNGDIHIETLPKHGYRFSAKVNQIFPATETVIEKRTVKTLSVRVENEKDDAPFALPPKRRSYLRAIALTALVLTALSIISLVWFWREKKPIVKAVENNIHPLTDGQFDDNGAHWINQGRIYFSRFITNSRVETWTMNADGTNQQRANTEIKNLLHGRWSPDGKKVVFTKEESKTMYLADADGGNEIVLPFEVGNMDWSPDGSEFVYQAKSAANISEIFLYTLKTAKSVNLTNNSFSSADPSFSPDGKQIAFTSFRDGNAEIYLMNTDGTNAHRLTNHPAFDNFPVFSPDGTQIAFQSNREGERIQIYLLNLNEGTPKRISNFIGETGIHPKCWSADGTQILLHNNLNGKDQIHLANVELYPQKLVLKDENADLTVPRFSPDGNQIVYQAASADRNLEVRLFDLATTQTKTIFRSKAEYPKGYVLSPSWSPDGQHIVLNAKKGGNTDVFIINADGSGLQNLTNDPMPDSSPIFSPDGNEIIFARDFYGKAQLYRMNSDGNNQRRLTEQKGWEQNPAISPDGKSLVFAGDRDGLGLDIYLLDFQNPNSEKLVAGRRLHDTSPAFSPDGKRIAFIANSDGNAEIYLMNTDSTGLFRLTHTKTDESAPEFSKDGKRLLFASNEAGKLAIYEIELP